MVKPVVYANIGRSISLGRTRVHLDRVEELGHFLELEVVLSEGEPSAAGVEEAHKLMAALGIAPTQLIEGAYVDLLAQKQAEPRSGADALIASAPASLQLSGAAHRGRSASDVRQKYANECVMPLGMCCSIIS